MRRHQQMRVVVLFCESRLEIVPKLKEPRASARATAPRAKSFQSSTSRRLSTRAKLAQAILMSVAALLLMPATAACQVPKTPPVLATNKSLPPEVEVVLDRIEQADRNLKDLQAKLTYSVLQLLKANEDDPDDVQNFFGEIRFLKSAEPFRFYIHFEKWNDGGEWADDPQQWVIFDGAWLTTAKENGRTIEREQIVRPGEKTDLFKLGHGPFPMPFGQKKADILEHFEVRLIAPSGDDPKMTDHLVCKTKPNSEIADRFEKIELFVSNDQKSGLVGLPVKIIAHNSKDVTLETVIFENMKKNKGLKRDKDFQLPRFTRKWDVSEKALSEP